MLPRESELMSYELAVIVREAIKLLKDVHPSTSESRPSTLIRYLSRVT